MLKKLIIPTTFLLMAFSLTLTSCKKDEDKIDGFGSIEVEFDNQAGDVPLNFGAKYLNGNGDTLQFSKFNYYVSNFVLVKEDGTEFVVPADSCYFLCKHEEPATRLITLNNVPAGDYTELRFMVGVDSAKSVSNVSERLGVLDPAAGASGMYWSWNAGYIFMKVEGSSPQAPLDPNLGDHHFEFHTGLFGGFSSPTINNLKTINLHSHDAATVRKDKDAPHFHLYVDVLEIFDNPTRISIAEHFASHADPFSATIADNYKDMFILDHVHNP